MKIQLAQQILISKKHRWFSMLDELCFKSKNLYNYALYQIKQHYKETGEYLSYYKLNSILSKENQLDYRSLPYVQCSFIDNEKICKHDTYCGKRIKRGLFESKCGHKLNADVNGSFNIMRLGMTKCNCDVLNIVPTDKRYVYNPVRIKINI